MSSSDEPEYIVEAIRGWRHRFKEKRKEFFIKWHDYSEEENTWEPESNLNCPKILENFKNNLSPAEKQLFDDPDPELFNGFKRNAQYIEVVGTDGPHSSDDEECSTKSEVQKFYCLILFDDREEVEEVIIKDFLRYQKNACLDFMEKRLLTKRFKRIKPNSKLGPKMKTHAGS